MYVANRSRIKRIGIDVVGGLCLVASALFGWLPGPGGIPLLILGLSLLGTNHTWAERILYLIQQHGLRIFANNPKVTLLIDLAGVAVITISVLVILLVTRSVAHTIAISLIFSAAIALLLNRQRHQVITRTISKARKRKQKD
ncbi:hypothetical protein CR970_03430 [Candidatus Saccharibacteria bacterium]|nr:MAG: hypothetical protein CR970_03430 [Candidatus Saccharibacteria bacterium]